MSPTPSCHSCVSHKCCQRCPATMVYVFLECSQRRSTQRIGDYQKCHQRRPTQRLAVKLKCHVLLNATKCSHAARVCVFFLKCCKRYHAPRVNVYLKCCQCHTATMVLVSNSPMWSQHTVKTFAVTKRCLSERWPRPSHSKSRCLSEMPSHH